MLRIKLNSKFLYKVINKDEMLEEHFRYTYLDIGYRGKVNIGQKYFLCIYEEEYAQILTWADIKWHSIF
jgi:hypothetical protein